MPRSGADILIDIRQTCLRRAGAGGIRGLSRQFRIMDDNGNHALGPDELRTGLRDFGIDLSDEDFKTAAAALDTNGDGNVDVNEFLKAVRAGLGERRLRVVRRAFCKFDKDGSGVIDLNDIRDTYSAKNNPLVKSGKKTEQEVLEGFLATFDSNSNPDHRVTQEEFEAYYAGLSASVDTDDYFEAMVKAAWQLDDEPMGASLSSSRPIRVPPTHMGSTDASGAPYQSRHAKVAHEHCWMDIRVGDEPPARVKFELYAGKAPKTCENFRGLCTGEYGIGKKGQPLHYKGLRFHRIQSHFIAQGGDVVKNSGSGQDSIYGSKFDDETFLVKHDRAGVLSMANIGPNSNGSQFFVTLAPTPYLDGKHVGFGAVVEGMDVIQKMGRKGSDSGEPICDVVIEDCGQC